MSAFLKSRAFHVWIIVNALFPVVCQTALYAAGFPLEINASLVYLAIGAILFANIYAIRRYPEFRIWFVVMMLLNIIASLLTSSLSFVTAIPSLPVAIDGLYQMIQQAGGG